MKRAAVTSRLMGLLLLAAGYPSAGFAQDTLQPYQLVRSLQLVQDRIAAGDHAAMPMQAKLLEMIDTRLREADAADFKDPKNFRALLVYGMRQQASTAADAKEALAQRSSEALSNATGVNVDQEMSLMLDLEHTYQASARMMKTVDDMLINPVGADDAREMFRRSLPLLIASFEDADICSALKQIDRMVGEDHIYEALKAIRSLYPLERRALGGNDDVPGEPRPLAVGARY